MAVHYNEHFLGIHNRANTDCQGRLGHLVDIVVKESGIGYDCVVGERLDAGPGSQG